MAAVFRKRTRERRGREGRGRTAQTDLTDQPLCAKLDEHAVSSENLLVTLPKALGFFVLRGGECLEWLVDLPEGLRPGRDEFHVVQV